MVRLTDFRQTAYRRLRLLSQSSGLAPHRALATAHVDLRLRAKPMLSTARSFVHRGSLASAQIANEPKKGCVGTDGAVGTDGTEDRSSGEERLSGSGDAHDLLFRYWCDSWNIAGVTLQGLRSCSRHIDHGVRHRRDAP